MSCLIRCSNGDAMLIGADLARHQDLTDEGNDIVPLLLGLLSLLDQFATCVTEGGTVSAHEDASVADDPLTVAALGVLSLRRSVRRWADHAAGDHQPTQPPAVLAPAPLTPMLR
jgi:hypothetical protein